VLAALWERESNRLSEAWVQALQAQPADPCAGRPVAELQVICRRGVQAFQAILQAEDDSLAQLFVADLIRRWASCGCGLPQIQAIFLAFRPVVRAQLLATYLSQDAANLTAFAHDCARLDAAIDGMLLRFGGDYQARAQAERDRQLAHLAELNARLAALATHDELTGLYNYRFFAQRLQEEMRRSRRYQRPLALIMADIDHFKDFNDRFGHQAGNQVLRQIATAVTATTRSTDIVARYGGEEFTVILPETGLRLAGEVAEHVRSAVADQVSVSGVRVTISLGVSVYQAGDADDAALLRRADAALYQAKQAGRNQVVVS